MNIEQMGVEKTPEEIKKIDKTRNRYEKFAQKRAKGMNTTIENLFRKGVINKQDVMQSDAEVEGKYLAFNGEKPEKNNDVMVELKTTKSGVKLIGEIDGKKIEIERSPTTTRSGSHLVGGLHYKGTIDGLKLDEDRAETIFRELYPQAVREGKNLGYTSLGLRDKKLKLQSKREKEIKE
jgi:hypothetical protein